MLDRVTGLFGWVEANDRRTLQLFLAFLLWVQLLTLVTSFLPLALLYPDYAPFYAWGGYFSTVVPGVTLLAAALFAFKLFWHVRVVRRRTGFNYVDSNDERRLCSIVEPLGIAAGIGTPYVGVIETPALNAFACGSGRRDAVIVVTRGLIDGLDDDQLAGVIAHEIAHIKNGDTRLMAAANICVDTIQLLFSRRPIEEWRIALGLLMTLVIPILFVLVLAIGLITQVGFRLVYATRLGISSSREFIADAEAIRLTQNPAAFVSALGSISGRSAIAGMATDQSSMMIDGDAEGETASHPRIAERIAAIVRLTGGMALIAPARRDTRVMATGGFGRRAAAAPVDVDAALAAATGPADRNLFTLFRRIGDDSRVSIFGFPKVINYALLLWVALFLGIHNQALANPAELAAKFDVGHIRMLMNLGNSGSDCTTAQIGWVASNVTGATADMSACEETVTPGMVADQARAGLYDTGKGTFSSEPPESLQIAQVSSERCFITGRYRPGGNRSDGRVLGLNERMTNVDFDSFMRSVTGSAFVARIGEKGARDGQLHAYVDQRTSLLKAIHLFYGDAGLATAQAAYAKPDHAAVVAEIAERLSDPAYSAGLSALDVAHHRLLVAEPAGFVPCVARIGRAYLPPAADPEVSVAREMRDAGLSLR